MLFLVVAFVVWFVLSATVPFKNHLQVGPDHVFSPESCYSDTEGTERAVAVPDSDDALLWRMKLIEGAQEEIVYSTFDLRSDNSGDTVMAYLLAAADRGVKVRLLVDGLNFAVYLQGKDTTKALSAHENVEIKYYNPVSLFDPGSINLRMHDKYIIVDKTAYMVGGRNSNDLFLGDYQDDMNTDMELIIYETEYDEESSINQVYSYFTSIWDSDYCSEFEYDGSSSKVAEAGDSLDSVYMSMQSIYQDTLEDMDIMSQSVPTDKVTFLTGQTEPVNKQPILWNDLKALMEAGDNVIIKTPYVMCGEEMYQDLKVISENSESFTILMNSVETGENIPGRADYYREKENILATDATVCEVFGDEPHHTKMILIDDDMSIVGSYNLDMRSTYLDTEVMVAVDSQELSDILTAMAETDLNTGRIPQADGSYYFGAYYKAVEMPGYQKILFEILSYIIKPVRYLL